LKLIFIGDYDGDEDIDWIDGTKVLRDQVKAVPDERYLSSFITKIGGNAIPHISDHLINIRKLYNLTDHNRIYSYLLSFGSPGIFSVFGFEEDLNPYFATLDELKEVFQTAEKSYNTILSFHDNYTDYFPKQPTYFSDLRVTLEDGTPAGESPSDIYPYGLFLVDPYDYAVQEGLERVQRTVERYPIKETYHCDVLGLIVPKDYSPESPSSRERNRRGIQLIIDEFAKSGINITSESITGYFVESGIGWFLDTPRILTNYHPFSNQKIIPLIEFIYHGKTLYGLYPDIYPADVPPEKVKIYTFLEPLLFGANSASHITYLEPNELELDKFYLIDLPWMALNQRYMQDYEEKGSYRKVTYDTDTFVEIDYGADTYTVEVDGRVISQNYKTVYPKDDNTLLVFARDQQRISEILPNGWDANIKLQKLTEDGYEDNISFVFSDRTIIFDADANTPYKLIKTQSTDDSNHQSNLETISGTISYNNNTVCAMVLANGQYMFTCKEGDDFGKYELDVPLDANGKITIQAFVSGLAPFRQTTDTSELEIDIAMQKAAQEARSAAVTTVIANDASIQTGWLRITGTVEYEGSPLCAMVLANGQYMFSCGENNGLYDLTVPLDAAGQITLYVFVSGFQPYKHVFTP